MNDIITRDMYLAAVLVSYGSQIVKVDKTDLKRQFFHFDRLPTQLYVSDDENVDSVEVHELSEIKSYLLSKKLFFPPNFIDCLRSVKAYLYSE